ncbi:hypothetical protein F5884DRAFT_860334 [Xylogone sp. PMI_703]|nr:hypothetical protein F5884DRAFT_860334 [Xylogone sp. PMI_703]
MHCQKVVRQWNSRETAEEREELAPALREAMDKEDEAWKAIPSYVSWKERREQGDLQAVVVLPPYPSWPDIFPVSLPDIANSQKIQVSKQQLFGSSSPPDADGSECGYLDLNVYRDDATCHIQDLSCVPVSYQGEAKVQLLDEDGDPEAETCANLICLQPNLHDLWSAEKFSSKIFVYSDEGCAVLCSRGKHLYRWLFMEGSGLFSSNSWTSSELDIPKRWRIHPVLSVQQLEPGPREADPYNGPIPVEPGPIHVEGDTETHQSLGF